MANKIMTLDSLKEESIRLYTDIAVVDLRNKNEEYLNMSHLVPKFNRCYAINNSAVCFVADNEVFVTPYTNRVVASLEAAGFNQSRFYVPFSNGDYPKKEHAQWRELRRKARETYAEEFAEACEYFCNVNHIGSISKETLEGRCLKIPVEGIPVNYRGYKTEYFPIITSLIVDHTVTTKIGKFSKNNGVIVFTYRDGNTYVAKGNKILRALKEAGYTKGDFFVPFSNGEEIMDTQFKAMWELIHK